MVCRKRTGSRGPAVALASPIAVEPVLDLATAKAEEGAHLVVGDAALGDQPADVALGDVEPSGEFGDVEEVVVAVGSIGAPGGSCGVVGTVRASRGPLRKWLARSCPFERIGCSPVGVGASPDSRCRGGLIEAPRSCLRRDSCSGAGCSTLRRRPANAPSTRGGADNETGVERDKGSGRGSAALRRDAGLPCRSNAAGNLDCDGRR